jgi:hypothetical protein
MCSGCKVKERKVDPAKAHHGLAATKIGGHLRDYSASMVVMVVYQQLRIRMIQSNDFISTQHVLHIQAVH